MLKVLLTVFWRCLVSWPPAGEIFYIHQLAIKVEVSGRYFHFACFALWSYAVIGAGALQHLQAKGDEYPGHGRRQAQLLVYGRYPSIFAIVCQVATMPYFYKPLG
jgi:hypothetical protein